MYPSPLLPFFAAAYIPSAISLISTKLYAPKERDAGKLPSINILTISPTFDTLKS